MDCPRCGKNLGSAEFCRCGYDLRQATGSPGGERFQLFGTTFQGARIVQSPASDDARRHMVRALAVAAAAPLILLAILFLDAAGIRGFILPLAASPYVAWASYWGTLGVTRYFADGRAGRITLKLAVHHTSIYGLLLPICAGIVYGTLGGGVYEFLRSRRIIKNPGLPL